MKTDDVKHASNAEIQARFDQQVGCFSNLETGQASTIDARVHMDLCTGAAKCVNPGATELLDIGCGAGNYTLKMLSKIPDLNCTLNDLSMPMLQMAKKRVSAVTNGTITIIQDDMRNLELRDNHFDIVLAATTLHHLRDDADWELMFSKVFKALKPGGSFWISDFISHDMESIHALFRQQFSDHLEKLGGKEFREKELLAIDYEDTPRPIMYQLDLLRKVGFKQVEILHKNGSFTSFGGVK